MYTILNWRKGIAINQLSHFSHFYLQNIISQVYIIYYLYLKKNGIMLHIKCKITILYFLM